MSSSPAGRRRWIVRAGDGRVVSEVLARAAVDAQAVGDGRVFVGRRRVVRADEAVHDGDVIEVAPPRDLHGDVKVLVDGGDVLAVDKPAGIPTIADHGGAAHALATRVARMLEVDPSTIHPTSRLDRAVSGVVVFARSKAAAERLRLARTDGTYARRYVAISCVAPDPESGTWEAPIGRAQRDPRLRAVAGRDPVHAITRYAVCGRSLRGAVLLAVAPITGRTHQIRVHASHAGSPLLGDRAYGGPTRLVLPNGSVQDPGRIALHALRVTVPASTGEALVAFAPVPKALLDLWSALGGPPDAWDLAASWDFAPS
jgi:23S rRNA pseudouridine1911/1915/1917 synthase